ncbi:hypothetical protein BGW36DRAFT_457331 [Talaromyces proteolyticus]|uniref:Uncharacterized protein n=1 Tax=Talaromyces proteolyticus TaxID=1131652 RepID=A0AAD4L3P0_9EURO|nr:uncharacterized protein BGW36DRAFT_457331 [Talaromyces proteolyticus]KAH8705996.1 hypothetical protein BGW36DRAFT_457331 [Talaromyces proteolyticus]
MPSSTIVDYVESKIPSSSILDQPYINVYNVRSLDSAFKVWQNVRGPLHQLIASVLDRNSSCIAIDLMKYVGQDPFLADATLLLLFPTTASAEHWPALEIAATNLVQEKAEDLEHYEKIKVVIRSVDLSLSAIIHTKQALDKAVGIQYDSFWLSKLS